MNVFIIGCGRVGSDLGKLLSMEGHNVVIVDTNPDAFKKLGAAFNGLQIIGSGTDEILLRENKADKADAFIALTDKDNINIMSAQIAKNIFNIPKVIAKVNDPDKEKVFKDQGFSIVSSTHLISDSIWNSISDNLFTKCYAIFPDVHIIRFKATEAMVNKSINELNSGDDFVIFSVVNDGKTHSALPNLKIKLNDELIVIMKDKYKNELVKILQ